MKMEKTAYLCFFTILLLTINILLLSLFNKKNRIIKQANEVALEYKYRFDLSTDILIMYQTSLRLDNEGTAK